MCYCSSEGQQYPGLCQQRGGSREREGIDPLYFALERPRELWVPHPWRNWVGFQVPSNPSHSTVVKGQEYAVLVSVQWKCKLHLFQEAWEMLLKLKNRLINFDF